MIGRMVTEARGMCLESKQPNACSSIPSNTDNINSINSKHQQDAPGSLATEMTQDWPGRALDASTRDGNPVSRTSPYVLGKSSAGQFKVVGVTLTS